MKQGIGALAIAALCMAACTRTSEPTDDCPSVPPIACTCPNGTQSVRRCVNDTVLPCDCPDASPASPEDGGSCISAGQDCRGKESACCNGYTCVYDPNKPSQAVCALNCLNGTQCNTGCCTALIEGTAAVCAPAKYCSTSCTTPGADCASSTCCANSVCVNSTVDGTRCAARCANHDQCVSGCCAPLNNTGELVCSPTTFCGF